MSTLEYVKHLDEVWANCSTINRKAIRAFAVALRKEEVGDYVEAENRLAQAIELEHVES